MALFKCKMCGGDLAVTPGNTIAECEYCGSMQTLPRVSDERLSSFYERANDLRINHEFDKALEIYEKIIEENPTDSDAYWSMVLCRYGIEYVEETPGGVRKPTLNRAQLVSVFEDVNYRSAIRYADPVQKQIYEKEAARIDSILQRYLEISRNEPAYDVFICYKETDADGNRTIDSVRAGEIYRELAAEGFKVFFAPVTLESKLGEDYEPYIFAAIHSAKVMVVIGTKPEYMNAVWVKNEWSRFLTLARDDSKKTLIPVYSGMDPYDMPEAFRFKQSQNMEKLGFMLDLVRGIEKLVGRNRGPAVVQTPVYQQAPTASTNVAPLLQRAAMFLEDRDWDSADIYCEKVLDIEPTNAMAFFYKLMAEAKATNEGALQDCRTPLENLRSYKNAVRYADEALSARLIDYNRAIEDRLEREETHRLEQERITRERTQQEIQQKKENLRIAEERRKKKSALSKALNNASDYVTSKVKEKERVETLLAETQKKSENQKKYQRKVRIIAVLAILSTVVFFVFMSNNGSSEVGMPLMILQFVLAVLLAGARGKSKLLAVLLTLFTATLFPAFSAIKGLREVTNSSLRELQTEKEMLSSKLYQLDGDISIARDSLRELRSKLEALDTDTEGTTHD